MTLIGSGQTLAADGPPDYCEDHVQNRHTQNEQRDKQRGQEEICLSGKVCLAIWIGSSPNDTGRYGHQQAKEQCPTIAHENFGVIEIVWQETETDTQSNDRDEGSDVWLRQNSKSVKPTTVQKE